MASVICTDSCDSSNSSVCCSVRCASSIRLNNSSINKLSFELLFTTKFLIAGQNSTKLMQRHNNITIKSKRWSDIINEGNSKTDSKSKSIIPSYEPIMRQPSAKSLN